MDYICRPIGAHRDADADFASIARLTRSDGHPAGADQRLDVERRERWHCHNPQAYTFYELAGQVVGFRTLFPIRPSTYWQLRRTSLAIRDLRRDDILTPEEAERCRRTGLAYFIGSWSEADARVYQRMLKDTFDTLSGCCLEGVYAETSGYLEEFAQAMTLLQLPDKGICPFTHETVRAWCADREYASAARTSLAGFFQQIDASFGRSTNAAPPWRLTEREKAVAYLYFVKRRTREETAQRLSISPSTVQDHINAVLRDSEQFIVPPFLPDSPPTDSPRTRIGDLLERYPQLLIPADRRDTRRG
ncbi:MAG TPA: hypothetical protein VFJ58_24390 [Armatimonadota bacterium]|nr:hypothetical protein [Armatimonadota bacterium]